MTFRHTAAASAILLAMSVGGTSAAFAKAHDQGVADGTPQDSTATVVESIDGPGVSPLFNGGQRGDVASGNGSDNAIDPVVGNGANQPD